MRLGVSNNALQQKVAVKIVTRRGMSHLDEVKKEKMDHYEIFLDLNIYFMHFYRFQRVLRNEVSILENLKHPNIVSTKFRIFSKFYNNQRTLRYIGAAIRFFSRRRQVLHYS